MTTFTIAKQAPAAVTGFAITNGVKTVTLNWDAQGAQDSMEVWSAPIEDLNSAVLIGSTKSNNFTPSGLIGINFFWVRTINKYGVTSEFSNAVVSTRPEISHSPTSGSAIATPSIPTISLYNTWYPACTIEWFSQPTDVITCTAYMTTSISNVVCSGSDRLAVFVRSRLFNVTEGYEVYAGVQTQLIYDRHGSTDYGPLNNVSSENDTFIAGSPGILSSGDDYRWTFEIMKNQVNGTPTCDLNVIDASCFADAAMTNI